MSPNERLYFATAEAQQLAKLRNDLVYQTVERMAAEWGAREFERWQEEIHRRIAAAFGAMA